MRKPGFYGICFIAFSLSGVAIGVLSQAQAYYIDLGYSAMKASIMVSLISFCIAFFKLAEGWINDRIGIGKTFCLVMSVAVLSMAMLSACRISVLDYAAAVLFGGAIASSAILTPLITIHDSDETFALSEFDSKAEIAGYGVPIPAQTIVRDKAELAAVCGSMKYPLALKINSSEILHKTDAGGVKLGIKDLSGAESAYEEILENIARTNPNAKTDGILVQEMAPPGIEIIIGISNDKMFGPMLLVGLGGIFVEIFKDVSLYPAPMNKGEAQMMLEKLKGYKLLSGYRGSEPCKQGRSDRHCFNGFWYRKYGIQSADQQTDISIRLPSGLQIPGPDRHSPFDPYCDLIQIQTGRHGRIQARAGSGYAQHDRIQVIKLHTFLDALCLRTDR